MNNKFNLFSSICQVLIGALGIISFFLVVINDLISVKWIITFILAIALFVIGIIRICDYKKNKQ